MKALFTNLFVKNVANNLSTLLILFLTFFIVSANLNLAQTNVLWSEDWEGNWTANWHVSNGVWQVGTPVGGPDSAYGGLNCAATVIDGYYPNYSNSRLIRHTPFIVPSENDNPRLRFWHWYDIGSGDIGNVQIKISGGNWETISPDYFSYGHFWTYSSIDLTPYAGDTVEICFLLTADNMYNNWGWYIDDVSVITGPISFNNPETWENGIGDWYADRSIWQVGMPIGGPGNAYDGLNCAATVLDGYAPSYANTRLISPVFHVNQNPAIGFWHWYSIASGDAGYVSIQKQNGDWENILGPFNGNSGGWTYIYSDLTAYSNSNIRIGFLFTSDNLYNSWGWYIDDIEIQGLDTTLTNVTDDKNTSNYKLYPNFPNPFNPTTKINYSIPKSGFVSLTVYDILGQEVATLVNERKQEGKYEVKLDASNLPSGIYIYQLKSGEFVQSRKMIVLK